GGPEGALRRTCPDGAIAVEKIPNSAAEAWRPIAPGPDDLAILQYTSGTTGEPRGVPITHANLIDNLRGMEQILDVDDALAVQWLPPYHDLGLIGGIFLPLFANRPVVLMSPLDFMRRPARWLQAISRYRATTSAGPNFAYELCLKKVSDADCEGLDLSSWQVAVSGAEPVRAGTIDRFCERFTPYGFRLEAFVPAYGMAETTLMVSIAPVGKAPTEIELDADALAESRVEPLPGGRRVIGCGPAGPGVDIRVVDPQTGQATAGVGEVWVRGASVARGYWRRPEVSRERFAQSCGDDGGFFRNVDLVFLLDVDLILVGRRKEMILLAGRNFYPHDIELALQQADPAFKSDGGAAVGVERGDEEQLVVFQEVQRPRKHDLAALLVTARRVIAEETGQQPAGVVLIPVGELPKTSSGKTRRAECWELYRSGSLNVLAEWPDAGQSAEPKAYEPPKSETEAWLADRWAETLGVVEVGRGDSFFVLGGRSLQVTQMLTLVEQHTGHRLPLATLFEHPTLASLARHIDALPKSTDETTSDAPAIDFSTPQPVSAAQQRFWLIEQFGVRGGANVPIALRLDATIEARKLAAALNQLIQRHAMLRCGFDEHREGVTQVVKDAGPISLTPLSLDGDATLEQALDHPWVWQPFDLSNPPLLRAGTIDSPTGGQTLLLVLHHLVCDGGSVNVLLRELASLLADEPLPPAAAIAQEPPTTADLGYWRDRLAEAPATIDLPLSANNGPPGANATTRRLKPALGATVDALATGHGVTPFLIYLSALQIVLSRYAGQQTVGVGTAVANRTDDDAVGCFINTLPHFAAVDEEACYADWLRGLQQPLLSDLDHAATPWEQIVEAAGKPRVPGRAPLVQTFLVHDDHQGSIAKLGDAAVTDAATDYRGLAIFDLALVVETGRPEPRLKLIHDARRLPPAIADGFLDAYEAVLSAVANDPSRRLSDLPVASAAEQRRLRLGGEPSGYPAAAETTAVELLASRVAETPDAIAVEFGDQQLTYGELDARSDRVAGNLAGAGVRAGDRVGLLLPRSIDLPTAIIGVWKAGAAYVPLDPSYPASRLAFVAEDAELACVVVGDGLLASAPSAATRPVALSELLKPSPLSPARNQAAAANQAAYVMYTSGSTGKPKGVVVPHGAVANLLGSFAHDTGIGAGDAMLGATTFAFDISVLELFLPLVTGARLVLAGDQEAGDAAALTRLLERRPVTHLQGTPSWFRMLLSSGWEPAEGQTILAGGEELPPDVAERLAASAGRVWNVYGPTETTIWSTLHEIDRVAGAVPIGQPIRGTRCYVLDGRGRLAPTGVWGELAIAGAGVATGYWNRPELTAERFAIDPFADSPDARMYRTGDTARWNADGVLEFGGRSDGQVKVRGHRVELREVELALASHRAVGEAAVLVNEAGAGSLVAYVAPANGHACQPADLLEHLAARLPGYMAPSSFIELPTLPKTANGKIDRKQLPKATSGAARSTAVVSPRGPLEEQLASWVLELLRLDEVGVFDNFFEIGGQSLLATQLVVRMRDELGVEPPLRDVYEQPTIAAWAELIVESRLAEDDSLPTNLLDRISGMSDAEAAEFLRSFIEG
ncbi:MAG: amino acid adenylation domain-containing protein, partial [Planctomycetota bacterium]